MHIPHSLCSARDKKKILDLYSAGSQVYGLLTPDQRRSVGPELRNMSNKAYKTVEF